MPAPLLSQSDFDHVVPGVSEHLDEIKIPLQQGFGARMGMGKWNRFNMTDVLLGTATPGALLTATNASGQLAYTILGDTMIVTIDTPGGLTLSATTDRLRFRLPDNWQLSHRQGLGFPLARAIALASIYDGASVTGFAQVSAASPETIVVYKPLAAAITAGALFISLQLALEVKQIGER